MKMLFEIPALEFTNINMSSYAEKKITLRMARLDKIHPFVSGNKLFKLHYFLAEALASTHKTILTFGGAWSNHVLATAYACKLAGLNCIGLIRGDVPVVLSNTLKACESYGMRLEFISRKNYGEKENVHFQHELRAKFGECLIVPEGGYHQLGAKGASLIMEHLRSFDATHICTAIGSATTLAGLMQNRHQHETVIGVPVLKNMTDIRQRISLLNGDDNFNDLVLFDDYHFGGYAKKTQSLIDFMNEIYKENQLPTDFVYTAKLMYAIIDKIKAGYFSEGSRIVCLHTGGLQGNASLPVGTLVF